MRVASFAIGIGWQLSCEVTSMAMAAPSLSSFGGQNVMLMRNDMGSSNSLVAMLNSCNPHVGFQGGWQWISFRRFDLMVF